MQIQEIQSAHASVFKDAMRLQTPRGAREEDVFTVEGVRAVGELSSAPSWQVRSLWLDEKFLKERPAYRGLIENSFASVPVYQVPTWMFERLSGTQSPQGILAIACRRHFSLPDMLKEKEEDRQDAVGQSRPLLIVLENVQDPGNVGTILRAAHACGAGGLILTGSGCDLYSPKVVRAAMGSLLHLPSLTVPSVAETGRMLKEAGVTMVGACLEKSRTPWETDLTRSIAILIGNEGAGLTRQALDLCEERVRIPMPGQAESLNAAMACGMLLYEAVRQRETLKSARQTLKKASAASEDKRRN